MKTKPAVPGIKIAIIESDPLRLVGFRALLEPEVAIEHCSTIDDLKNLKDIKVLILSSHDEVTLADRIAAVRSVCPGCPVPVAGLATDEQLLAAIAAGARGYVAESATAAEFTAAISSVKGGSIWAPRRLLMTLIEQVHSTASPTLGRPVFTSREKQVLDLLAGGCCNKDIANTLGIEVRTVKAHVGKLMRKAGVKNRVSLCVRAVRHSITA
jgi:DNA-binding NarL/FixJ family response regulator